MLNSIVMDGQLTTCAWLSIDRFTSCIIPQYHQLVYLPSRFDQSIKLSVNVDSLWPTTLLAIVHGEWMGLGVTIPTHRQQLPPLVIGQSCQLKSFPTHTLTVRSFTNRTCNTQHSQTYPTRI